MRQRCTLLAVIGLLATSVFALDPKSARAEYDRMQKWQFSREMPLATPVTITRDTANWKYTAQPEGNAFILTMDIERRDVPDSFITAIPVRIVFENNK